MGVKFEIVQKTGNKVRIIDKNVLFGINPHMIENRQEIYPHMFDDDEKRTLSAHLEACAPPTTYVEVFYREHTINALDLNVGYAAVLEDNKGEKRFFGSTALQLGEGVIMPFHLNNPVVARVMHIMEDRRETSSTFSTDRPIAVWGFQDQEYLYALYYDPESSFPRGYCIDNISPREYKKGRSY